MKTKFNLLVVSYIVFSGLIIAGAIQKLSGNSYNYLFAAGIIGYFLTFGVFMLTKNKKRQA